MTANHVAVFCACCVMASCKPATNAAGGTPAGAVVAAPAPSPAPEETIVGLILPQAAVDVSAEVDGRVTRVRVQTGMPVRRGDPLFDIDSRLATQEQLDVATGDAQLAESDVEKAALVVEQMRAKVDRLQALRADGLVDLQQLEDARYQLQIARVTERAGRVSLSQKQAIVRERQQLLRARTVRAPFSGIVSSCYIETGMEIGAGTPAIRIVQSHPLHVRFAIPDLRTTAVQVGSTIAVRVDGSEERLTARVVRVWPEVDSASQVILADALFREQDDHASAGRLVAGRTVRVVIEPSSDSRRAVASP